MHTETTNSIAVCADAKQHSAHQHAQHTHTTLFAHYRHPYPPPTHIPECTSPNINRPRAEDEEEKPHGS